MIPEHFFIEAGNRICSYLELDKALRSFFDYIRGYIPVRQIGLVLGDVSGDAQYLHVVAWATENHAVLNNNSNIDNYLYSTIFAQPEMLTVVEELHGDIDEWPIVVNDSHFKMEPPFVALRLQEKGRQRGGMIFLLKNGTHLTPDQLQMIKGLHAPALIAFANCLNFMELTRLREKLTQENLTLQNKLELLSSNQMIGSSRAIKAVLAQIRSVAALPTGVLITGESGTGKEVAARLIHALSKRADQPFIAINCGAIPENLVESELFGYEKGAFTGSYKSHKGKFERAEGGTLFLDEIAELPLAAQVKLLRVVQEKKIERIGGEKSIPIDVRIIAATNQNLENMVQEKRFRDDLFYRLSVFVLNMPPLRERREDIPFLAAHFLRLKAEQLNIAHVPLLTKESMAVLSKMPWPGNVRELENFIERQLVNATVQKSKMLDIQPEAPLNEDADIHCTAEEALAIYLNRLFVQTHGKISGKNSVASISGLSRDTVYRYKKKYGLG